MSPVYRFWGVDVGVKEKPNGVQNMARRNLNWMVGAVATLMCGHVIAGPVMDEVKSKGSLVCLVSPNAPGFSVPDSQGVFQGFNADFAAWLLLQF